MSVYENVAFPLRIKKTNAAEIDKRTTEALRHTNLLDVARKSPADLSGGGKQRVALARALAINPSVMLLDEPLSSLDPHLREEMRFEIKELQKIYGFSIMYVTHDQSEAMALSDRILVMKNGVVQQIASPLEVYQPSQSICVQFYWAFQLHGHDGNRKCYGAGRRCRAVSFRLRSGRDHCARGHGYLGKPPS